MRESDDPRLLPNVDNSIVDNNNVNATSLTNSSGVPPTSEVKSHVNENGIAETGNHASTNGDPGQLPGLGKTDVEKKPGGPRVLVSKSSKPFSSSMTMTSF